MSTDLRQDKMSSRLKAMGVLHQDAKALALLTYKWADESGEEWTVKRFKALKLEFITGTLAKDCVVRRAPWIKRRDDGTLGGPLSRFWNDPYYKNHPQVVLNALQVYSSFVALQATPTQISKFVSSASADVVALPPHLLEFIKRFDWSGIHQHLCFEFHPYWRAYRSPIKRVPALKGTAPEDELHHDLEFSSNSEVVRSMYRYSGRVMNLVLPVEVLNGFKKAESNHDFVGSISFIQEAGYKLRAVANPTRVVQHVLEPLKGFLGSVLKTVSEDCTFDQERGVTWCQSQLASGRKLFSIDLSDATNLFPFEVQEAVLSSIFRFLPKGDDKEAFKQLRMVLFSACKGSWRMPDGTSLKFVKGQPLGLGPSFFLFALSHHMILYSLNGAGKYVILGDDIVISDDVLAAKYRSLMSEIGCSISEDKSIASQHIAEFASRLIRPNDVLRQWKWRQITRSNVIDICRNYGPEFRSQVVKPMSDVIDALAPIPKELGGLGWNAKGVSLSSRIGSSVAQYIIFSIKEEVAVFRRWDICATSDFLRAHALSRGANPDVGALHPRLPIDFRSGPKIFASLATKDDWVYSFYQEQDAELNRLDRPGPNLGETILWPMGVKAPNGYILWGPLPSPWRTEPTSGLYRVVARILRGEKCAMSS